MQGANAGGRGGWFMNSLIESYKRVPRALRWLLFFGGFIVVYYAVLEPALDSANRARDRADRLEASLRRERAISSSAGRPGGELDRAVRTYGLPRHPTDPEARPESLQRTVNAILMKHGVSNATYSERMGAIPSSDAAAVVGAAAKLDRFVLDVSFDASPADALAILSDLEQAREVTSISRVKIDKAAAGRSRDSGEGGRVVRVNIAVESWIAGRSSSASTASLSFGGRP